MFLQFAALAILFSTEAAVPPASEEEIDVFVASLPQSTAQPNEDGTLDREGAERLIKAKPDREQEIRSLYASNAQCKTATKQRATRDLIRLSAREFGSDKLLRLKEFYQGPDYALFISLSHIPENKLSNREKIALDRITRAYPLEDFFDQMREAEKSMWRQGDLLSALLKCDELLDAELMQRELHY